jgi:pyridoxal 5'-phosphate synthase pdxS subunit
MDVVTPDHAKIAEDAGACAVMALERVLRYPCHWRCLPYERSRTDLKIMDCVSIPVMAKCVSHFVEAQILNRSV